MKRFMNKKSIRVLKTIDENNLGSIARTFLSSFMIIFIFYSLPIIINFTNDKILNTKEFKNNSKTILAYTLDKKKDKNVNNDFDENDLLVDKLQSDLHQHGFFVSRVFCALRRHGKPIFTVTTARVMPERRVRVGTAT